MAYDASQESFMNMEIQGEGIYASTMFLDTSDQEADQGLTLSPKIQLNDTWLFDAHDGFQDQDLDVLLGPVNFDVTIDEPQEHDLSVENLIDDQSQLLQRSPKRQKLTRALLKPIYPLIELNQSICQHEGPSLSLCSVDVRVPSFVSSAVAEQQQTHDVCERANTSPVFRPQRMSLNHPPPNSTSQDLAPTLIPQRKASYSSYQSPYAPIPTPTQPAQLQDSKAIHCDRLILNTEQRYSHAELQDGHETSTDLHDEQAEVRIVDRVNDDDGSLFGDYVSSEDVSSKYFPTVEPLCLESPAELEAELEAQLDAELEAEFGATDSSATPGLLLGASHRVAIPTSTINVTSEASSHVPGPSAALLGVFDLGLKEPSPSWASAHAVFSEGASNAAANTTDLAMHGALNVMVPPVEEAMAECQPSQRNRKGNRASPEARKTPTRLLSPGVRLLDFERKLAQVPLRSSPQRSVEQSPCRESVFQQTQANKPSPPQSSPAPLPYLLALSFASGESKGSIETLYRALRTQTPQPSSPHRVPPQLRTLLDSLYVKFYNDVQFRTSTLLWAMDKVSSQHTQCCDSAAELVCVKEELERVTRERDAYKSLVNELRDVIGGLHCKV